MGKSESSSSRGNTIETIMPKWKSKISPLVVVTLLALISSAWFVFHFPAFHPDEEAVSVMAHSFIETGTIRYTVNEGVIDPQFELISSSLPGAVMGIYLGILGVVQKVIGLDWGKLRLFSFLAGLMILGILFAFFRKVWDIQHALTIVLVTSLSFVFSISSHLIRPEILLSLFFVSSYFLLMAPIDRFLKTQVVLSGLIAGCSIGIHPNGLFVICLTLLFLFLKGKSKLTKWQALLLHGFGFVVGCLLVLFTTDLPHFSIGKFSYKFHVVASLSQVWISRLSPLNAIADATLPYLTLETPLVANPHRLSSVYAWMGLTSFFAFLCSWIWTILQAKRTPFLKVLLLGSAVLFLLIGVGQYRSEATYLLPAFLLFIPVTVWIFYENLGNFKKILKNTHLTNKSHQLKGVVITFVLISMGFLWVFRFSLFFYAIFLLGTLVLDNVSDRKIMGVLGLITIWFLALWLRDKNFMAQLYSLNLQSITSISGLLIILISSGGLLILGSLLWRRKGFIKEFRSLSASFLKLCFLLWCFGASTFATLAHEWSFFHRNPSLLSSIQKIKEISGPSSSRVLGPSFLWFAFGTRYRSINAIAEDYFYSGQKRPKECIKRYRPDLLVLNENFIRRFLLKKNTQSQKTEIVPITDFITDPLLYRGPLKGSIHHTPLQIFQINWSE
ncbi:hypothetical protein BVX98_03810 [bacterium F11]|nr:hypothetical protein BVX98_03810 [bacterium F11]